uniref:Uncharacterized protein n=1 Tax=Acrobeloides nanus TaxID=290746 RepID=A0A914DKY7_9BILA
MAAICSYTLLQSLREMVHDLSLGLNIDLIPCLQQGSLQRFNVRMGFRARFLFKNAPHAVVEGIEVGTVGWSISRAKKTARSQEKCARCTFSWLLAVFFGPRPGRSS